MKVKKMRPEAKSSLKTAVKNVKKVLKTKDKITKLEGKPETQIKQDSTGKLPEKELKYTSETGVLVLSHIPHGFYEEQMQEYCKQFGKVLRVRLVRSKRSGRSRGFGYVEFENAEVAKIVAETMNNYVMCGRLIKASYIPPEKQHFGYFFGKEWTKNSYPKLENRKKEIEINHALLSDEKHSEVVKKSKRKLSTLQKKLLAKGIDFKFEPVDSS